MNPTRSFTLALALVALMTGAAWSQTQPQPDPSPAPDATHDRAEPTSPAQSDKAQRRLRRLKRKRARLLRNKLGLDEARASRVEAIFDTHAQKRRQARTELRRARRQLRRLLRADSDDQAAYKAALDALQAATKQQDTLRDAYTEQLREVLTPKEQAQLMRMMTKVRRHLRRARRRNK